MENVVRAALVWLLLSGSAWATCSSTTTTPQTLAIQSPCSPNIVSLQKPDLVHIAIADANMIVPPSAHFAIQIQAPGVAYVWVAMHGYGTPGAVLKALVNDGLGTFSGTVDLSHEHEGPLVMSVRAAISDQTQSINAAEMTVFVDPASWDSYWSVIPPQAAAAGFKTLHFNELFHKTSGPVVPAFTASPCKPGTGVWPHCTAPTATDGFRWYENKPNGGDYGLAAFEHTDSATHNPFSLWPTVTGGFLRIRSTHDVNYVDPYGFSRHWYTGFLATAFPDGTTSVPMNDGYYEAQVLVPNAACSPTCGGGTWPSFFMQTINAMKTACKSGDIEEDVTEEYGNDPTYTQMGQHPYCGATGADSLVYAAHPEDLSWDWHRHGLLVTDTTISYYLDDALKATAPRDQLVGGVVPQWFLMATLAMGGGWPVNAPPAGSYDLWIRNVRYLGP